MPPEFSTSEVEEYAYKPHAANVVINEFMWLQLKELAAMEGCSVSEVARTAISCYLDGHNAAELIEELATAQIELDYDAAQKRAALREHKSL